ncbi:ATP-dependent protease ATPase subunit HslU [Geodia barretti]|uniref:ATP-dependent protease ATPase subunit HslU n=1 Tax=Geodia barretti TaxID=519541 RepID=A0AA35SN83_GEOBA|nr:ATP-dependent protease ATPase subunit HslU [Geodia barretti]
MSKPSDLIPELQGRFRFASSCTATVPRGLRADPHATGDALIKQYTALLGTEGVELDFTPDAIARISEVACEVNSNTQNIGARRLHTILEHILEEVSFHASDAKGQQITVTAQYVDERLAGIIEDRDLTRFIL